MVVGYFLAAGEPTTVHTAINWPALAISLGSFIASMVVILTYIDRRSEKRQTIVQTNQDRMRAEFKESIESLGTLLSERLETKDNVNMLKVEVAKLSEQVRLLVAQGNAHGAA